VSAKIFFKIQRFNLGDINMSAITGLNTDKQIDIIEAAAAAENAIDLANTLAKVHTMGFKAAKDIVG
jgi:hypothetical protein